MRINAGLLAVLPATWALIGCTASRAPEGVTTTFVVSALVVPSWDETGRCAGVDLDGVDSDGLDTSTCMGRHQDFVSLYDPGERGIDNRISDLINGMIEPLAMNPTATDLINTGQLALALRISNIDSYTDDDAVEVQVGTAHVPGCDMAAPETCVPVFDGTVLSSGQPMVFEAIGAMVSMKIVMGRLQGELGAMSVPAALLRVPGEWAEFPMTVRNAHVDAAIREEALDGSLGGGLSVGDMVELGLMLDPTADPELGRRAVESEADLDPSPSNPLLCAALSIGIQLSAVRVTPVD